jgi:cytochrome c oxidase cbb3-type subunit 3
MGLILAVLLLIIVSAAVYFGGRHAETARLLRTAPDSIPADAELLAYGASRGQGAYDAHCASCHGTNLAGNNLKGVPSLVDDEFLYGSGRISEIERIILYGIRSGNSKGWDLASMPAFGKPVPYARYVIQTLTPQEIEDVTNYVYSFQHEVDDDASLKRGETLFRNRIRGTCYDCHAEDAEGDNSIGAPNLTTTNWLYGDGSKDWIRNIISNGLEGYCPQWIGRLSFGDIRAIAVYVYSKEKRPAVRTASAAPGGGERT